MGALLCRPEKIDFDGPVTLYHFSLLRSIGKGAFGKVQIVQHKQSKALYALKYINKAKCVRMKAVPNIIQERRLLEEIDCQFVVNMRYAFQDDDHCYLVLDLMLGGDLRFHLERLGSMSEASVRIYVAEIATAISFLHERKIVHRDLKPDNILLDEAGHAHITDLNIAVHVSDRKMLTGVAGSMAYMAPEVLARRGYTYTVDWWSLGVLAFELIFGRRPFRGKSTSDLTTAISYAHLRFPEDVNSKCSPQGVAALKGLMERDHRKRLGCTAPGSLQSFLDFQEHPWFEDIDWDKLTNKEIMPPFVPDAKRDNYNPTHELERLLLDEDTPRARKRDPKRIVENLSPEMRMLEEDFLNYDFKASQRRSYYPTNPHTVTSITMNSSAQSRPVTPSPSELDRDHGQHLPQIRLGGDPGASGRMSETEAFDETLDIRPVGKMRY